MPSRQSGSANLESGFAKATGLAKFIGGHTLISLFEEVDDLLVVKSGLFHSRYFLKLADFVPSLW